MSRRFASTSCDAAPIGADASSLRSLATTPQEVGAEQKWAGERMPFSTSLSNIYAHFHMLRATAIMRDTIFQGLESSTLLPGLNLDVYRIVLCQAGRQADSQPPTR